MSIFNLKLYKKEKQVYRKKKEFENKTNQI